MPTRKPSRRQRRKVPKKTSQPRAPWPPRSFDPGFPGVREQLERAYRVFTSNGFLVVGDPQNDIGDGQTWMVECKSTDKLPRDADLACLARQCLDSKGIAIERVLLKGQMLQVTLSPPAKRITQVQVQPAPVSPEAERERLWAERIREMYGVNVDAPNPSRSAIIREYMETHNGKQPSLEDELEEAFRQYRGLSKVQADLPVDVESIAPGQQESCFTASIDYRSIRFNGVPHALTRNQGTIIKILHEAFQRGTPSVGTFALLAAVESESSRVKDFFRRSPLWRTLVVSGERRGTYRLNLPARG
jgi:hypothetical protein